MYARARKETMRVNGFSHCFLSFNFIWIMWLFACRIVVFVVDFSSPFFLWCVHVFTLTENASKLLYHNNENDCRGTENLLEFWSIYDVKRKRTQKPSTQTVIYTGGGQKAMKPKANEKWNSIALTAHNENNEQNVGTDLNAKICYIDKYEFCWRAQTIHLKSFVHKISLPQFVRSWLKLVFLTSLLNA